MGAPDQNVHGRAISRVGDTVSCPLFYPGGKPHGVNRIVTGHASLTIHGVAVAVDGCMTECGCTLIGSRPASVD
ncbi:MAG: PAAR domain-containing protein [Massilia sp.]